MSIIYLQFLGDYIGYLKIKGIIKKKNPLRKNHSCSHQIISFVSRFLFEVMSRERFCSFKIFENNVIIRFTSLVERFNIVHVFLNYLYLIDIFFLLHSKLFFEVNNL